MNKFFQQGDVLFHQSELPNNLEVITSPVIQEGEHTGHAHRIVMFRHGEEFCGVGQAATMQNKANELYHPNWEMLLDKSTGTRYLKVADEPIEVSHEEHKTISVPPGKYRIEIVREYDHFLEEARKVVD